MSLYPHSNDPDALGIMILAIAPVVFLLCSFYNAYRLGRFRKPRKSSPVRSLKRSGGKWFLFAAIPLTVLLALIFRFAF